MKQSGRSDHRAVPGKPHQKMVHGDQRVPLDGTRAAAPGSRAVLKAVLKAAPGWRGYNDSNRNLERGRKPGRESLDCRSSGILLPLDMCAAPPAIGKTMKFITYLNIVPLINMSDMWHRLKASNLLLDYVSVWMAIQVTRRRSLMTMTTSAFHYTWTRALLSGPTLSVLKLRTGTVPRSTI